MKDKLEQLRKLLNAATPGRWLSEANNSKDLESQFSVDSTAERTCASCGQSCESLVIADSFRSKADADLVAFLHNNAIELFEAQEPPVEPGVPLSGPAAEMAMSGYCPDCGENVYPHGNGRRCRACLTVYTPSIHLGEFVMLSSGRRADTKNKVV